MLLGEIELLTVPPPSQAASPQMLAIAMRNAAGAKQTSTSFFEG